MLRYQLPAYSPVTLGAVAAAVLASVRGDPQGLLHRRVCDVLKSRYGATDVLLSDSGTSALRLAIGGARRGLETRPIALPGYCCYDVATAAVGAGAQVTLYDLDTTTLGPQPASLGSAVQSRPAAVVIAHLYGLPVDVPAVRSQIGEALLIEDAAQGAGGSLHGRPLGSFGSVSVLSFGRGKGTAGGGGGALLAHDDRGAAIVEWARGHIATGTSRGLDRQAALLVAQWVFGRPASYGIPATLPFLHLGETLYRAPWSPRPASVISLAALDRSLQGTDREAEIRRANGERWLQHIQGASGISPFTPPPGAEAGYLRFPVRVSGGTDRAALLRLRRHGVMPGYPATLRTLPDVLAHLVDRGASLPGAAELANTTVTLPTHSLVAPTDVAAVRAWARMKERRQQ